jgi:hypothetical protein
MPQIAPTQTSVTARTTLGLPVERFQQLKALAQARDLAPAALVEEWITRAVAEGAPGAFELPGYSAFRDDNVIVVTIAGRILPMLSVRDATKLWMLLSAAAPTAGEKELVNSLGPFTLQMGAARPLDLGPETLVVGRKGRGVVFFLKDHATGKMDKFAAPTSYIADLARMIRTATDTH